jgi:N-acetylgalactosamine-6-sulfatase
MPDWLDPTIPTLPRLLQTAGYETAHFGKWHIGDGPGAPEVAEYGFDECRILCQGNGPSFGIRANHPRATAMIIDETIRFLRENRDSPVYINAWPLDVHAPLDPTEEALQRYEHLMSGRRRTAMQIYFAVITEMDRQIGRLVEAVDEMGLAEDTIIVFSSDNGPEDIYIPHAGYHAVGLPGPFRGRKRSLYEGGVREPFILRWKGHEPESHVDDTTVLSATDLLPSFCSLAGVTLPHGFETDGEDMSAAFRGANQVRKKPLMWEWRFHGVGQHMNRSPMLAIRDGDWKLLLNPDRSRLELYHMIHQPYELHSAAEKHPEIVEKLAGEVLQWQSTLPPGPTIEKPGQDAYRWPQEIRITEEDILHD